MGFACWITKVTDTHSEYVAQQFFLFHGNKGFATALHYYVDTLLVFSFHVVEFQNYDLLRCDVM